MRADRSRTSHRRCVVFVMFGVSEYHKGLLKSTSNPGLRYVRTRRTRFSAGFTYYDRSNLGVRAACSLCIPAVSGRRNHRRWSGSGRGTVQATSRVEVGIRCAWWDSWESGERQSGRCMTSVRRSDRSQRFSSGLDTRRGPFELGIPLDRGTIDGRLQTIGSVRTTA
uniref:Uncharacterized protein n=1 Tax=Rhodococcus sp. NS1 TaxID=402236 RepID=A0A097SQ90_9NOCA|nr:hypothetical protein LRS1606.257 [Rhodococcus sp. NS1]